MHYVPAQSKDDAIRQVAEQLKGKAPGRGKSGEIDRPMFGLTGKVPLHFSPAPTPPPMPMMDPMMMGMGLEPGMGMEPDPMMDQGGYPPLPPGGMPDDPELY